MNAVTSVPQPALSVSLWAPILELGAGRETETTYVTDSVAMRCGVSVWQIYPDSWSLAKFCA
jgi:hypothetical protein